MDHGASPSRPPGPTVGDGPGTGTIHLPSGGSLLVRPTSADDADLLAGLYAELPEADRYRRFFSAFEPDTDFCRTWATVGDRGGFGVIALVDDPPRAGGGDDGGAPVPEVAGEAAYALRADGDGDLAVTVAVGWRGWLGSYLVDVLCRHAAAAGITGLQADVLLDNRPMLGLLRHRGAVALEHPDGTVRVAIGTGSDVPSWAPRETRRRVLVEVPGGRWAGEDAATASGVATALCSGPRRRGTHGCPVLDGGRCPLADEADAIVVLLDPSDEEAHRLVAAHRQQSPRTPVLVRSGLEGDGTCRTAGRTGEDTVAQILSLVGTHRAPPGPG